MLSIDRQIYRQAKSGEMTKEELANYLLKTFPVYEIALALAETINYEEQKPIPITQEEFSRHFRIIGVKPDGTPENRGRRKDRTP